MPVDQWSNIKPDLYWVLEIMLPSSLAVMTIASIGAFHKPVASFIQREGRTVRNNFDKYIQVMNDPRAGEDAQRLDFQAGLMICTPHVVADRVQDGLHHLGNIRRRKLKHEDEEESATTSDTAGTATVQQLSGKSPG